MLTWIQVVLASGKIVTATSTQYSDLFWALKGGGNSFGVVTRFDLLTYTSPTVCAGITEIPSTEKDLFLSAVANFGQYGSADPKAAVIPSIFMLASLNITVYTSALFYDGTNCTQPALANFTAIPAIENTYGSTTLATYVEGTDALIADGTRQAFRVVSSLATAEALSIVHDTFVDMVTANIWDVAGLQASVAFQPVTKNFIQQGINKGGNPQGVDISKAPYFCRFCRYISVY
jgi:FAD/FMN-containing dehydrogenase